MSKSDHSNYFVCPMPVDVWGNGPADEQDTFETFWQIWKDDFTLVSTYKTQEEAYYECSKLNSLS